MRAWASLIFLALSLLPATAESVFVSSVRLRGGYDSNPLLAPDGKGAAFTTLEAAFAGGRKEKEDGWVTGVTGEFSATKFSESEFRTFQNNRFRLRLSNDNIEDLSLDSTMLFANASTYDTRVAQVVQRTHVQYAKDAIRPFTAMELRLVSLNELNPLLGGFLPEPMKFMRGTIAPGVAYTDGKNEIAASVVVGRTKFEGDTDLFGFRRDNNRVQPTLSGKYEKDALSLRGSISYFQSYSEDIFFTDVSHFLFDISATVTWRKWSVDASFAQTAEETSFPVSPMTINRLFQARLSRSLSDDATLAVFARGLQRDYWDTPLYSTTRLIGVEANYVLNADVTLAGELAFARSQLLSGNVADGVVATVSLTKHFGGENKTKK
jgi:hypothetical protein